MAIAERIEQEARLLLGGVSHAGTEPGGQEPVAIIVEQSIVVFGHDLIAAENHDAPSLLEKIIEGRDLGLTELGDVAEDDRVVGRQLAPRKLRLGDDLDLDRPRLPGRLFAGRKRLGQIIGLGLVGLGLEMAVDQQNVERLADRHDQPAVVVALERIIVDEHLDQMVARRGELLAEDGRHVFTGRKIKRLFESQTPSAVTRARTPSARALPKLRKFARIKTGSPIVTTGTSSFRSVTARFSPPGFPRSITTDRGWRASSRATARLSASPPRPAAASSRLEGRSRR